MKESTYYTLKSNFHQQLLYHTNIQGPGMIYCKTVNTFEQILPLCKRPGKRPCSVKLSSNNSREKSLFANIIIFVTYLNQILV